MPSSIPEVSDGVAVPANRAVAAEEAARRADIAYHPYHPSAQAAAGF